MTALPIAAGMLMDNSSLILGSNNNTLQVNGFNTNIGQTTVNGTAGSYTWSQPAQGISWKMVIIYFNGYSNTSTTTITFSTAFTHTPLITANGTGLTISTLSATTMTIPISVTQTGFLILQGF